jgi:tRNA dimethylallyltransferase
VGGTGFYLRALFAPLFAEPALEPARRGALQRELDAMPTEELRRWCRALDPARAHLGRAQLLRALELSLLAGRRISELHATNARAPRFRARYLLVDPGDVLRERIAARAGRMMEAGWEDEVRRLMRSVPADAPAWNASGYRAIRALAEGTLTREEALARVVNDTRHYAKRQRTWFRHQLAREDVTRVDPDDARAGELVEAWWQGEGGA